MICLKKKVKLLRQQGLIVQEEEEAEGRGLPSPVPMPTLGSSNA